MDSFQESKTQKHIVCKVEKVLFRDDNTSRTIMTTTKNDGKKTRLLGKVNKVEENYILKATGYWRKDAKYGWQFEADFIQVVSCDVMNEESEYIECKVSEVKILKAETGFASVKAEKSGSGAVRLSGRLAKVRKDSNICVWGKWKHDEKYGDEFQVSLWEYVKEGQDTVLKTASNFIYSLQSAGLDDPSHITIPDTVETIGNYAFEGCEDLLSIIIPESVESIGDHAFQGCKNLTAVAVPNSVKNIGTGVFENCENLSEVVLPDSMSFIPKRMFAGCKQLKSITLPESIKIIGEQSFEGCINLCKVNIPDSAEIASDAFENCPPIPYKTMDIEWDNIQIGYRTIYIPDPINGESRITVENATSTMNDMIRHLSSNFPKPRIHYFWNSQPVIENIDVFDSVHDTFTMLQMKNDLWALIRSGRKTADILKVVNRVSTKDTRIFIPRDMTPYIDFLYKKQAIDCYPIVPIEEYIGGSREKGALFTIIKEGHPYIVWENFKDSRASYVFKCTAEGYQSTRQLIFDYIMTEEDAKRQFLRTDKCKDIFGQKPTMLVHNNLDSWSERLMSIIEDKEKDASEDTNLIHDEEDLYDLESLIKEAERRRLIKGTIYAEYELNPEWMFADDELYDDDGDPVEMYFNGEKDLSRKVSVEITPEMIEDAMSHDDNEEFYECLCYNVIDSCDYSEAAADGINTYIISNGMVIYETNFMLG